jgi:hypothetical protein
VDCCPLSRFVLSATAYRVFCAQILVHQEVPEPIT